MPQQATPLISFHIEHIVSRQHGGADDLDGLALACDRCNAYMGPNLTSIDPETHTVVALFNPRLEVWSDHFVVRRAHCRADSHGMCNGAFTQHERSPQGGTP